MMATKASATALSTWLLKNNPGVFATILKHQTNLQRAAGVRVRPRKLGDDDDLTPVDVTASYIDPDIAEYTANGGGLDINTDDILSPVDVTAQQILTPVNVTAQSIPIDTSAANASTSSITSSLGSSIGSAISSVATFLLKGAATVAPVAVAAFNASAAANNSQAAQAVLATQLSRAGVGAAPANIAYTANGTPVYIPTAAANGGLTVMPAGLGAAVTLPNGQTGYTLTPQALSNLQPSFLQQYGIYLIGGAALLLVLMMD